MDQAAGRHNLLAQCTADVLAIDKPGPFDVTQIAGVQVDLAPAQGTKVDVGDAAVHRVAHHQLLRRGVLPRRSAPGDFRSRPQEGVLPARHGATH